MTQLREHQQEIKIYKNNARSVKYFYDVDGDLEYKGYHMKPNAATSDSYWWVTKYIYDVSKDLTDKKWDKGILDDRASLDWT